jgi:hypothetical protein
MTQIGPKSMYEALAIIIIIDLRELIKRNAI